MSMGDISLVQGEGGGEGGARGPGVGTGRKGNGSEGGRVTCILKQSNIRVIYMLEQSNIHTDTE